MSAANPQVTALRQSVQQSCTDLQALLEGPVGTLYTIKLYQTPTENEWTIMENLAHVVEFMPYWGDEVAKLVAQPGRNFGRTMQHEGRQAALREHSHDTLEQARAALPGSYAHLDEILSRLQDQDLELTGQHVKSGERTLAWFVREFIADHLHNHVLQIKACLDKVN